MRAALVQSERRSAGIDVVALIAGDAKWVKGALVQIARGRAGKRAIALITVEATEGASGMGMVATVSQHVRMLWVEDGDHDSDGRTAGFVIVVLVVVVGERGGHAWGEVELREESFQCARFERIGHT